MNSSYSNRTLQYLMSTINSRSKDSSKKSSKLNALRILLILLSTCLVAGLGTTSFFLLRSNETKNFNDVYYSSSALIASRIERNLERKLQAATVIDNIFSYAVMDGYIGKPPNITLPGFDDIMMSICALSTARGISVSPLVTQDNRHKWEAYATSHVDLLEGPSYLKQRVNGSWIVADGVYNKTNGGKLLHSNSYNSASRYPLVMMPIWQVAPMASSAKAIMYDVHSSGSRMRATDDILDTKQGRFTDIIQLVEDGNQLRPSTVLLSPITAQDKNNTIIAISSVLLSWDDALQEALPSHISGIQCVLSTSTSTFTFLLSNGEVKLLGTGDLHDATFNKYEKIISKSLQSLSEISAHDYVITLYPTNDLYLEYITDLPIIVTISLISCIGLTIILAFIYEYLLRKHGKVLEKAVVSAEGITKETK
eukprot:gene15833-33388_t